MTKTFTNSKRSFFSGCPKKIRQLAVTAFCFFSLLSFQTVAFSKSVKVVPVTGLISSITQDYANPNNLSFVSYKVNFSSSMSGLTASNFKVNVTGTLTNVSIIGCNGSGATWSVIIATGTGDGNITLVVDNTTGVTPAIATTLPYSAPTYGIDKTAPSALTAGFVSNNTQNTNEAKVGDVVTLGFTATEQIKGVTISIAGTTVTALNPSGDKITWVTSYTMKSSDTEGIIDFNVTFTDLAGNAVNGGIPINAAIAHSTLTFDKTSPTVVSINRQSPASQITTATPLTFRVTFSEPISNVTGSAFHLINTGSATATIAGVQAGPSQSIMDVQVNNVSGIGTIAIGLNSPNAITDGAGNALATPNVTTNSYTIIAAPTATTLGATAVTATSANLTGSANDNGDATKVSFVYGTDPGLQSGTTTTLADVGSNLHAGAGDSPASLSLSGLSPGVYYYYQVSATNTAGTTLGSIRQFTTTSLRPTATTSAASAITISGGTLNASVNDDGTATTVSFTYSFDPTMTTGLTTTPATTGGSISAGSGTTLASLPITGFHSGTRIYYQVAATNSYGTTLGAVMSFSTINLTTPTNPARNLTFNNVSESAATISWTSGSGTSRAVFIFADTTSSPRLSNNTTYLANSVYGSGSQIAAFINDSPAPTGWYCIYNGTGSTVTVTGLNPGQYYRVSVMEYNGPAGNEQYIPYNPPYNPANFLTLGTPVNKKLIITPTQQPLQLSFANTTTNGTTASWANGSGDSRVVFIAQTSMGIPTLTNGTDYTASTTFGSGTQVGTTGWYCVYNGSNTDPSNVKITGLASGTTYRVIVMDYNGKSGEEKYLSAANGGAPANVTTVLTVPTTQASKLTFTSTTATGSTISWTNGNGAGRAVFISQTGSGYPTAADLQTYTANTTFRSGQQIGSSGWYCIYNGTNSTVNVTGLTQATTYRVGVIEYIGASGSEKYLSLANGGAPASFATVATLPTTQSTKLLFTNITTSTATVSWTSGNGAGRAVFIAKTNTGYPTAVDQTTYTVGQQIGATGWVCIYNGTGSTVNITGLSAGTTYRVGVIEYTGTAGSEKYLSLTNGGDPVSFTSTLMVPSSQAYHLIFTNTTSTGTALSWTSGNGSARAVFIAQTGNGYPAAADLTTYTANTTFRSGTQIGSTGWYCVYNGTGSATTITGLSAGITYRVGIIEYIGSAGSERYLSLASGGAPASFKTLVSGGSSYTFNALVFADAVKTDDENAPSGQAKLVPSNILTPNGDGKNDTWTVKNIEQYPDNKVTVSDQRGNVVFTQKGYDNNWGGTYRGNILTEGTYYYLIDLGNNKTVKGFLTVVRDK